MQSREQLNNNPQKLSIIDMIKEKKMFIFLGLLTLVVLTASVIFLTKDSTTSTPVPKEDIVSSSGIHWHPKLTITIDNKKQEIPANIGILPTKHEKIHTHDQDAKEGVVHMEMQGVVTKNDTKLGNFFRIWGKDFNPTQIFDKKNGADGKVTMTVNGEGNNEFENYLMRDGDKIEIRYE